jgi:hypothetical protein
VSFPDRDDGFWIGVIILFMLALAHNPDSDATSPSPVSCPSTSQLVDLERRVRTLEVGTRQHAGDIEERLDALTHDMSTGLVDLACLYRGHLAASFSGFRRDTPVPTSWWRGKTSDLWPTWPNLSGAECLARWK